MLPVRGWYALGVVHWTVIVAAWCAVASVVSASLYAVDKRRAVRNRSAQGGAASRRIPERTLHLADLLGGWPGGLLARKTLRHKTDTRSKSGFVWISRLIIAAHLAAWVAIGMLAVSRMG